MIIKSSYVCKGKYAKQILKQDLVECSAISTYLHVLYGLPQNWRVDSLYMQFGTNVPCRYKFWETSLKHLPTNVGESVVVF